MPNQNIGDVIEMIIVGKQSNSTILSGFKYQVSALTGTPTTDAVANALNTYVHGGSQLVPLYLACCAPDYTEVNLTVQTIAPTRFLKKYYAHQLNGTYADNATTANLAGVITRRGAVANKHNIGSLHVPYPNLDTDAGGGTVSGAYLNALNLLASAISTGITLTGIAVLSPCLLKAKAATQAAIPIVTAFAQQTIRVMRRRTAGLGI